MITIDGVLLRKINLRNLRDLIWRNPEISMAAKVVLLDLIFYAGVKGNAFPSHKTLAKDLGISTRYVRSQLNELRKWRCIDWKKRGFSKSNSYAINTDLLTLIDVETTPNVEQKPKRKHSSVKKGTSVPQFSGTGVPPK